MKKYALALWWWSAKWIAHIWVIKYLEEKNVKITEVSWTSMGAIIWACLAIWKTSKEMVKIISNIKYLSLIDLNLKESVISWNKVYNMLKDIFWDWLIENTKIPLKIVATNLENWEKHVFENWKIVDAIRASISLPWIFKPHEINWIKYLDWCLKSNLPVLELKEKNIIAVSVIKEENKKLDTSKKIFWINFKSSFWEYNYKIIKRAVYIVMKNNEDLAINNAKSIWKNILLIEPKLYNYEYFDFFKYKEIIKLWYEEIANFKF